MDYNKIIIVLLIIIAALAVTGVVMLNQTGNNTANNTSMNNTSMNNTTNIINNTTNANNNVEHISHDDTNANDGQSKPPRTEYTGDPNDREAYTEWRKQDLQSENPHRGYSMALDGVENSPTA